MQPIHRLWGSLRAMFTGEHSDEGATLVEYILLVVGIALIVIVTARIFGGRISAIFNRTGDCLQSNRNC